MDENVINAALAGLLAGVQDFVDATGGKPASASGISITPGVARARMIAAGGRQPLKASPGQMLSPFCGLKGHRSQTFLPLEPLDPEKRSAMLPGVRLENPAEKIQDLWNQFFLDWGAASSLSHAGSMETLLALLQRYAWSIPSGVEGVSIYDLARCTAAVLVCLEASGKAGLVNEPQRNVAILVAGDLSGLQKFLYNLASDGAAKSLRARSVYLQWLTQTLAHSLLRDLGLPTCNLLYAGGGTFRLLAPVNQENSLEEQAADLSDRLFHLHQGSLGITLAWEKLSETDFHDFASARSQLASKLNRLKRQPFAQASIETLQLLVGQPLNQGGDPQRYCQVTGEDGETLQQDQDGHYKSAFVIDLEQLGRELPNAEYLVVSECKKHRPSPATGWAQALKVFGFDCQLIGKTSHAPPMKAARIWRFKASLPEKPAEARIKIDEAIPGYTPLAQMTARNPDGKPKLFDELAHPLRGALERWGVLRMDLDNLGALFQEGIGLAIGLARTAGFSFMLRLFFEGWLPRLAEPDPLSLTHKADLREHLYLQYSGGDDLFIVGAWDALPEFALRVHQSLGQFSAHNPQVTLSAGIELFPERFPLYQAAERAREAEEQAKQYRHPAGGEKDAICFLGATLGWQEFEQAAQKADRLAHLIDKGVLPRSVPQAILGLNAQVEEAGRGAYQAWLVKEGRSGKAYAQGKPVFGPWTWKAAYQLNRAIQQIPAKASESDRKEAQELIQAFRLDYLQPEGNTKIQAHGLIARWAQFLTRGDTHAK